MRGSRTRTILSALLGVIALAGALGVWWWRSRGYVTTDDARIKAEIVSISADIAGRIAAMAKDEGDAVSRGEIMASLDRQEVEIRIKQAQAEIERGRSKLLQATREIGLLVERQKGEVPQADAVVSAYRFNLEDALAHAEKARENWQRTKALFARELISAQELTGAATELRQAEARVSALKEKIKEAESAVELVHIKKREVAIKEADLQAREAEVRQAEASLAELHRRLQLTSIRSPVAGLVVKKYAHQGEVVQAGQPIFMVVDANRFWVEANVEETEIRHVRPGSPVIIKVDSYPEREFLGKVIEVGGATVAEFSLFSPQKLTGLFIKSTQRLPVKISVHNTDGLLKVGMLAVVWIERNAS
ncbi:MAG: efflux RND transporter periplasmic adaptor subunit [Deltaproteobacteria bacterium]|nr:efflux RND transporter periplasmic adaptor subunit [Deltaproteobacteria bacterium]